MRQQDLDTAYELGMNIQDFAFSSSIAGMICAYITVYFFFMRSA